MLQARYLPIILYFEYTKFTSTSQIARTNIVSHSWFGTKICYQVEKEENVRVEASELSSFSCSLKSSYVKSDCLDACIHKTYMLMYVHVCVCMYCALLNFSTNVLPVYELDDSALWIASFSCIWTVLPPPTSSFWLCLILQLLLCFFLFQKILILWVDGPLSRTNLQRCCARCVCAIAAFFARDDHRAGMAGIRNGKDDGRWRDSDTRMDRLGRDKRAHVEARIDREVLVGFGSVGDLGRRRRRTLHTWFGMARRRTQYFAYVSMLGMYVLHILAWLLYVCSQTKTTMAKWKVSDNSGNGGVQGLNSKESIGNWEKLGAQCLDFPGNPKGKLRNVPWSLVWLACNMAWTRLHALLLTLGCSYRPHYWTDLWKTEQPYNSKDDMVLK